MSQSPIDAFDPKQTTRYRQGWKALNRLLHEAKSFSGDERHCAFLNMKNGQFATVSAVTGLDYMDDGRAAAVCDWDFDGRLDLWLTARSAPRIRYLRNSCPDNGSFLAIHLIGNGRTTNRDAIGARVELTSSDGTRSIRTLHAGDGFLTQSSRWIHFGLGEADSIETIQVRWPGGELEAFDSVKANGFYWLKQDTGVAEAWQPPSRKPPAGTLARPAQPEVAIRTVLPYRLPLPEVNFQVEENAAAWSFENAPTLVTVWSASCPRCVSELTAWSRQSDALEQHGIRVLALQADMPGTPEFQKAPKLLKDIGFPFVSRVPTTETFQRLDLFQRAVMDLWQPMPVPTTFLLDPSHRVMAIYKGEVEVQTILKDLALIDADSESLRKAALPFPGRWAGPAPEANPIRVSSQLVDHRMLSDAVAYLDRFLDSTQANQEAIGDASRADIYFVQSILLQSIGGDANDAMEERPSTLASTSEAAFQKLLKCRELNPRDHRFRAALAKCFLERRDLEAAKIELLACVDIDPRDIKSRRQLVAVLYQGEEFQEASNQLEELVKLTPDAATHFNLANTQRRAGNVSQAIAGYRQVLDLDPKFIPAGQNLAWLLATHPATQFRSGDEALQVAKRLCDLTQYQNASLLDALAAAYAEVGQFDEAVKTLQKAIALLEAQKADVSDASARLKLYQAGKPFRSSN